MTGCARMVVGVKGSVHAREGLQRPTCGTRHEARHDTRPRVASKLSRDDRESLIACLSTRIERYQQRLFHALYPSQDEVWRAPANKHFAPGYTVYRRELYQKHLEFFRAGAKYRERCFMAANRTGKTLGGAYEVSCHLTGLYPDWWEGRASTRITFRCETRSKPATKDRAT